MPANDRWDLIRRLKQIKLGTVLSEIVRYINY